MLGFAVLQKIGGTYSLVAFGGAQGDDDRAICERAFEVTNSFEGPWYERAAQNGIEALRETRSTSVGDLVAILNGESRRFYRCDSDGWSRLYQTPVIAGA